MTILIITDVGSDGHAIPVIKELAARGNKIAVLDPATWLTSSTLSVSGQPSRRRHFLSWEDQELDLDTVTSVWYRRPGKVDPPEGLTDGEREWVITECTHLSMGLWETLEAFWVSHPTSIVRGSRKLLQLRIAAELGLTFPSYQLTRSPEEARSFIEAQPRGAIVKALSKPTLMSEGRGAMMYTHLINPDDLRVLESVDHCPTFFQEFVPKELDVRVTVFGDKLFAVGIDSSREPSARVDFRRVKAYDLPHHIIELPDELSQKCLRLVRELGLEFGAIDFLLTPDDEYVFLEINPNGQWMWIELITGLPMTTALCELLEQGNGNIANEQASATTNAPPSTAAHRERFDFGSAQTVRVPPEYQQRLADDPSILPSTASQLWADEKDGDVLLHIGDFADDC